MTENEAKVIIEGFLGNDETINEAIEIAGKALEEVQQYRTIRLDIQKQVNECEERALHWEERISVYSKAIEAKPDNDYLKLERQQCIGKKNELLAVADFGNKLLQQYFS